MGHGVHRIAATDPARSCSIDVGVHGVAALRAAPGAITFAPHDEAKEDADPVTRFRGPCCARTEADEADVVGRLRCCQAFGG